MGKFTWAILRKFQWALTNPYRRGEDFLAYPTIQVPNLGRRAKTITGKTAQFSLPPVWLTDAYEKKRDGEIRKKQKEVQRMLHALSKNELDDDEPKREVNPNSLKNLKHFRDR